MAAAFPKDSYKILSPSLNSNQPKITKCPAFELKFTQIINLAKIRACKNGIQIIEFKNMRANALTKVEHQVSILLFLNPFNS
jgi:hypothetical protein